MKVENVHERVIAASPEQVISFVNDDDRMWPDPVPKRENGDLRMGTMRWHPTQRDSATRAFQITEPAEFEAEHWFEVEPAVGGGATLRHVIRGMALGDFEDVWRYRIEPMHDAYIEALLDKAQEALA